MSERVLPHPAHRPDPSLHRHRSGKAGSIAAWLRWLPVLRARWVWPPSHGLTPTLLLSMFALVASGIGVTLGFQTWQTYAGLVTLHRTCRVADELLSATMWQLRGRSLVAARLASRSGTGARGEFVRRAERSQDRRRQAIERIDRISGKFSADATLHGFRAQEQTANERLLQATERVSHGSGTVVRPDAIEDWMFAISASNSAIADLRDALLASVDMPSGTVGTHSMLTYIAWELAEHAGRVQALLTMAAFRARPPDELVMAGIEQDLERVHATLAALSIITRTPDLATNVRRTLEELRLSFDARFESMALAALDDLAAGRAIDATAWHEATMPVVDEIVELSLLASKQADAELRVLMQGSRAWLLVWMGLILVTVWFGLHAFRGVRRRGDELLLRKELAEVTLHSIGDAVLTSDACGRVTSLNPVAAELTGWSPAQALGRAVTEIFRLEPSTDGAMVDPVGICLREERVTGLVDGHRLVRRDGVCIPIEHSAVPIRMPDSGTVGCVLVFHDTGALHDSPRLLSYYAARDPLTGLANRREFNLRLKSLVGEIRGGAGRHVLACIDIDRFRVVNDTCGYAAGDQMLRGIGRLLCAGVRSGDVVARLGSDEFAVLLRDCPLDRGVGILERLSRTLHESRFDCETCRFPVSVSVGIVPVTATGGDAAQLLAEADAACCAAKEKGRNRIQVYRSDDRELAHRRNEMQWIARLDEALREERFLLYCQPIRPLAAGVAERIEILLRLRDRDGSILPPAAFIPAAERYDMMPRIDRWVIRTVCARLAAFSGGGELPVINVNLSALSLGEPDLAAFVIETAAASGIAPYRLCFEITETAAIGNMDSAHRTMQELCSHGFGFALDDFGTGLASFDYLRRLPVQQIKIGDDYVRRVFTDPLSYTLLCAVVEIGRVLGIGICAECVEDAAMLPRLARLGIASAQGHAVGEPGPFERHLNRLQSVTAAAGMPVPPRFSAPGCHAHPSG